MSFTDLASIGGTGGMTGRSIAPSSTNRPRGVCSWPAASASRAGTEVRRRAWLHCRVTEPGQDKTQEVSTRELALAQRAADGRLLPRHGGHPAVAGLRAPR